MTDIEKRALAVLAAATNREQLLGPNFVGDQLWGANSARRSGNCSAPYARPAGKLLNRLRDRGFCEWVTVGVGKRENRGWRITPAGRRALIEASS